MTSQSYAYILAWKARTKKRALDYLGARCVTCGVPDALDFDHIDPATKVIEISNAIARCWSWERIRRRPRSSAWAA